MVAAEDGGSHGADDAPERFRSQQWFQRPDGPLTGDDTMDSRSYLDHYRVTLERRAKMK